MALPLKTGADFYNKEAQRMRLHNLGADPTEYAAGLIYFNTSSDANTAGKIRVCMGSGSPLWKTLAYAEDLDVASNSDFIELKKKVDAFLGGGVDADNVLENLAEVQKFLDNYSGATSLSEILNGKLDKSGGTITSSKEEAINIYRADGPVGIKLSNDKGNAWVGFSPNAYGAYLYTTNHYLHITTDGKACFDNKTLIHSGNIGSQQVEAASTFVHKIRYLASDVDFNSLTNGGILTNYGDCRKWKNAPSGMSYGAGINIKANDYDNLSGQLAWDVNHASTTDTTRFLWWRADDDHAFANAKWHQIAFTDSTVAAAQKLVKSSGADAVTVNSSNIVSIAKTLAINPTSGCGINIDCNSTYASFQTLNANGNWQSTNLLFANNGDVMVNSLIRPNKDMGAALGSADFSWSSIFLKSNINKSTGQDPIVIHDTRESSGYQAIRFLRKGSDYAALQWFHDGFGSKTWNASSCLNLDTTPSGGAITLGSWDNPTIIVWKDSRDVDIKGTLNVEGSINTTGKYYQNGNWILGLHTDNAMYFNYDSRVAPVLYWGKTHTFYDENGTRLIHIVNGETSITGDLRVTGNIIADGEVSAGGVAAEGGGTSGGGGGSEAWSETFTPTQTSITFTHNLGTQDVIVQVYEKDSITSYWNMVMVDVEVISNSQVTLHFGATENIEHKVVILG